MLPQFPWQHERRYNAYANYFKKMFGERIQKLSINAGFTCPNRDGTISWGGCTFCNNDAFNPSYCQPEKSITQQLNEGIEFHEKRYRRAGKYLAYFQAFSNTYAPLEILKAIYEEALQHPKIIGLIIGTRPDCVDDAKLDFLKELSEKFFIMVEYGIESCFDRTLARVNRGHYFAETISAIRKTAERNIKTGGHLIFGFPGESRENILEQAAIVSKLPLTTIKFHQLQIFKNTPMEQDYLACPEDFPFMELPDYIDFVIDFVERLNPAIVIERFAGEVPPRFLTGKNWGLIRNDQILTRIEKSLTKRNTWQGRLYQFE